MARKKKTVIFGAKERERNKILKEMREKISEEDELKEIEDYIAKNGVKKIPAARAQGSLEAKSLGIDV